MRTLLHALLTCLVISTWTGCSVISIYSDSSTEFVDDLTTSFPKESTLGDESFILESPKTDPFTISEESTFFKIKKSREQGNSSLRYQSMDSFADAPNSSSIEAMGLGTTFESLPPIGYPDSFVDFRDDLYGSSSFGNFEFPSEQVEHDLSVSGIFTEFLSDAKSDLKNFYTAKNGTQALAFLGVGAWMANSNLDQNILQHIQEDITFNNNSNEYQEFVGEFRFFGEGYFLLPVYFSAGILGKHVFHDRPKLLRIGHWGDRCFRGIVLGTPPLILSQYILGASRPGETNEGSEWQFLADNNGVSGHAFMGAVPFLTAYHMTENRRLKVLYFAASTIPALSRITENGHYPSQALLGWGLAYLISGSVAQTELQDDRISLAPYMSTDAVGIGLTFHR